MGVGRCCGRTGFLTLLFLRKSEWVVRERMRVGVVR